LTGTTEVREVCGSSVRALIWTPADFGLPVSSCEGLRVNDVEGSATLLRGVLDGQNGPARNCALANAAAAIYTAGRAGSLAEGVSRAAEAIDNGRARKVLEKLVACSPDPGGT
jgi:anthranilate phosphoribosyltransferase